MACLSLQQGWGRRGGGVASASGKQVDAAEGGSLSGARMEPGLAAGHRSRKALLEKKKLLQIWAGEFSPTTVLLRPNVSLTHTFIEINCVPGPVQGAERTGVARGRWSIKKITAGLFNFRRWELEVGAWRPWGAGTSLFLGDQVETHHTFRLWLRPPSAKL